MGLTIARAGSRIADDMGRILILRGVNLAGSSQAPFGAGGGSPESLNNPESASFEGRPFPPEEAEGHFEKLKSRGFALVRLFVPWEALEPSGPGIYDEAYLAYLRKLLLAAEKKGVCALMEPCQNARAGAPAWALEKLGMDPGKLEAAGAARQAGFRLYAEATMFTLFFAGNAFAGEVSIDGERAQDWLQEKYLAAYRHCFRRLKNCKALAGWGAMSEPRPGFIGCRNLRGRKNFAALPGMAPTPFQGMVAASGSPVEVSAYRPGPKGRKAAGKRTINPEGLSIFREGFACPWKQAGVWAGEGGGARLLKPDHFSRFGARPARFADDFLKPFLIRFIERMKGAERPALYFIGGVPGGETPSWGDGQNGEDGPRETVCAFRGGPALSAKRFRPRTDQTGSRSIPERKKTAARYSAALAGAKAWARDRMGGMPCFLAEAGLPFDPDRKRAPGPGDWRLREEALSLRYDGIDKNLLGSAIGNYCADNAGWEGGIRNGDARAAGGWLRPYPAATAGLPLAFRWDGKKGALYFRFLANPDIAAPTEIFMPAGRFGENPRISIKTAEAGAGLTAEYLREEQRLLIRNDGYRGEAEIGVF